MPFSPKRWAYSDKPIDSSHSVTPRMALPAQFSVPGEFDTTQTITQAEEVNAARHVE